MPHSRSSPLPPTKKRVRPLSNPLYTPSERFFCKSHEHNRMGRCRSFPMFPEQCVIIVEHELAFYGECLAFYEFTTKEDKPTSQSVRLGTTLNTKKDKDIQGLPSIRETNEVLEGDSGDVGPLARNERVDVQDANDAILHGTEQLLLEEPPDSPLSKCIQDEIDAITSMSSISSTNAIRIVKEASKKKSEMTSSNKDNIHIECRSRSVTEKPAKRNLKGRRKNLLPKLQIPASSSPLSEEQITGYPRLPSITETKSHMELGPDAEYLVLDSQQGTGKLIHRMSITSDDGKMNHMDNQELKKAKPLDFKDSRIEINGLYLIPKVHIPNGIQHGRAASEPTTEPQRDVGDYTGADMNLRRVREPTKKPPKTTDKTSPMSRIPKGPIASPKEGLVTFAPQSKTPTTRTPPPMDRPYRHTASPPIIASAITSKSPTLPGKNVHIPTSTMQSSFQHLVSEAEYVPSILYPTSNIAIASASVPLLSPAPPNYPLPSTSTALNYVSPSSPPNPKITSPFANRRAETPPLRTTSPVIVTQKDRISSHTSPLKQSHQLSYSTVNTSDSRISSPTQNLLPPRSTFSTFNTVSSPFTSNSEAQSSRISITDISIPGLHHKPANKSSQLAQAFHSKERENTNTPDPELTSHLHSEGILPLILYPPSSPSGSHPTGSRDLNPQPFSPHLHKDKNKNKIKNKRPPPRMPTKHRRRHSIRSDLRSLHSSSRKSAYKGKSLIKRARILSDDVRQRVRKNKGKVNYPRIAGLVRRWGFRLREVRGKVKEGLRDSAMGMGMRTSTLRMKGKGRDWDGEKERRKEKEDEDDGLEFMCRGNWDQIVKEE